MKCWALQMTGQGMGAIGVVLLAGADAAVLLERMAASLNGRRLISGEVRHVRLAHPVSGEELDDAVVACVGEGRFELHVHGGVAVMGAVLEGLREGGAEVLTVEQGLEEGILGVGLEGEVLVALPRARTMMGLRLLLEQREGGLGAWATRWGAWLGEGRGRGDLWRLHSEVQWVLERSRALERLLVPARVAIVGPPNAGKSTLANALLGRDVSITSEVAGTTRDWVDGPAVFRSGESEVPVVLVDTAGIWESVDVLERESIVRTHEQAAGAEVMVLVFDGSRVPTSEELGLVGSCMVVGPVVVVWNKMDLVEGDLSVDGVRVSARTLAGLEGLMGEVLRRLDLAEVGRGEVFAFTGRQREVLGRLGVMDEVAGVRRLLSELVGGGRGGWGG